MVLVPDDFYDILGNYTGCGFRVLGCAIKNLNCSIEEVNQITREEAENNLIFVGFLIMHNRLKPETIPTIEKLKRANIESIMVTGDNPLTACYIAYACNLVSYKKEIYLSKVIENRGVLWQKLGDRQSNPMELFQLLYSNPQNFGSINNDSSYKNINNQKIDKKIELAVTGNAFDELQNNPQEFSTVLEYAHVYARMKPAQKQKLVESLEDEKRLRVGMCGDGANDCSALKTANVGISLSEAEASIAAPFTSGIPNITQIFPNRNKFLSKNNAIPIKVSAPPPTII